MVTYSFKEIWDAIYTEMLKLKDTDAKVWWVYNYDVKIEDWIALPAIIITPSNGSKNYLDSCSYETNLPFTVRLFDRIQDWIETMENNMRIVADMMLGRLADIDTITWTNNSGTTVKLEYDFVWGFWDSQEPIRVFEVECRFVAIEK